MTEERLVIPNQWNPLRSYITCLYPSKRHPGINWVDQTWCSNLCGMNGSEAYFKRAKTRLLIHQQSFKIFGWLDTAWMLFTNILFRIDDNCRLYQKLIIGIANCFLTCNIHNFHNVAMYDADCQVQGFNVFNSSLYKM